MIRKGRIIVSLGMLLVMVLTFGGLLAPVLPHWQFLPALLAGNFLALALILAVTFLFGRVYCSVLCPLGISQDLVIWLSGRRRKKRRAFAFARERRGLRYAVLFLAGLSILFGYPLFLGLVDPYSIFGRILNDLFALPVSYGWNAIVGLSERYDWLPLLMKAEVQQPSAWAAVLAGIYLIVLVALSWRHGRAYCHTICPVGTLLGTVSRFSVFRPVIDADRCIHCGACERTCPSACIDAKTGVIDSSRCVDCFDCLTICPKDALHFSRSHHAQQKVRMTETEPADTPPSGPVMTRRELLGTTALAIGTVARASCAVGLPCRRLSVLGILRGKRLSCRRVRSLRILSIRTVPPATSVSAAAQAASCYLLAQKMVPCTSCSHIWTSLRGTVSTTAISVLWSARPVQSVRCRWRKSSRPRSGWPAMTSSNASSRGMALSAAIVHAIA